MHSTMRPSCAAAKWICLSVIARSRDRWNASKHLGFVSADPDPAVDVVKRASASEPAHHVDQLIKAGVPAFVKADLLVPFSAGFVLMEHDH